jgi:hypothetical protein
VELTLANLTLFLMIGIVFFCVAVIAMVVLFGLSTADLLKKPREMVLLFIMSLTLPVTVAGITSRTAIFTSALSGISITSSQVLRSSPTLITVRFTTSKPAYGYLEYFNSQTGTWLPILPDYPLSPRISHTINITGTQSAPIWITINGQRVQRLDASH